MVAVRRHARVAAVALSWCINLAGCSSDSESTGGPSANDRAAWKQWASSFVGAACAHDESCGTSPGAACVETGMAAADSASCDAAVAFYLANRTALDACIHPYPPACGPTPAEACPLTKDHPFESLCP